MSNAPAARICLWYDHNAQDAAAFYARTLKDQAETDRYWNAIVGNGGAESACGWCKDKWGVSWQITPTVLTDSLADPDAALRARAETDTMSVPATGGDAQSHATQSADRPHKSRAFMQKGLVQRSGPAKGLEYVGTEPVDVETRTGIKTTPHDDHLA